ncbi:hypothetical protein CRD70_14070 [Listeria monocytogenes]|uniref:Uncharacterized protein n=1 Tax=Listeria monocytogenes TaxID=1639 RepID=A0A823J8F5_LISMN|nr:hypothetical protein [Listeria monocytogenes]EAG9355046.1 hypothetical protein [Listeria monocytogenes]RFQ28480.1 hypothetical protein CRD70_14070 [Listeria monocytogenes]UIJ56416.1 hypothetical protein LZJ94_14700 [Listeria monocytogenes]WIH38232.1 hypothetical protein MZN47_14435 [Listeria monocytogenes]
MNKEMKKIQVTLYMPKNRKHLNNTKLVNHRATVCIPQQFNEADFIKAFYELQKAVPNNLIKLKAKKTKKTIEVELKKVEFLNFGKYKVYENEYELLFDETDYATINYAMLQNIKILGAYSAK